MTRPRKRRTRQHVPPGTIAAQELAERADELRARFDRIMSILEEKRRRYSAPPDAPAS